MKNDQAPCCPADGGLQADQFVDLAEWVCTHRRSEAPLKIIGNGISGQLRITFTSPEEIEVIFMSVVKRSETSWP